MEEQSVIEILLERMDSDEGFAGFAASLQTMSRLDEVDLSPALVNETILRDAPLTAKLLRVGNSSIRASKNISTIDQAIGLIGMNTVGTITTSLTTLEGLENPAQSQQLHGEIAAAYFCGSLAAQVTRSNGVRYSVQESQVCALMQNLGRTMAMYYLYEEIEKSQALQADENLSQDDAVARTIGATFADIGYAIVQHWKFPDTLQGALNPEPIKAPPRAATSPVEWHRCVSIFARRVTDVMFRAAENQERMLLTQHINFFRTVLQLKDDEIHQWIRNAMDEASTVLDTNDFPITLDDARATLRKASERVLDTLGAQDSLASNPVSDGGKTPIEVIQQMLRLIHNECKFDLTLLCLPNGSTGLVAIAGLGRKANQVTPIFRCQGQKPDIFRLIAAKKVDMYVADTQSASFKQFIPDWYNTSIGARSFMLMSLVLDGQFIGMVYGDYTAPRAGAPEEAGQEKVKSWRAQMAQALVANKKPA